MGHFFAHTVARKAHRDGILDIRKGFSLFRDRQVPLTTKFGSVSIGVLLTGLLMLLEIPIEGVVGFLLPFVGPAIDVAIDGAEVVLLPMLIAAAVLPHLFRRSSQALVHAENIVEMR